MKFIDEFDIELVNQALNFTTTDCIIEGGCDLFTTKSISQDRKLYKKIDHNLNQMLEEHELSKSFEKRYSISSSPPNWSNNWRRPSFNIQRPVVNGQQRRFSDDINQADDNDDHAIDCTEDPYMSPKSLERHIDQAVLKNDPKDETKDNKEDDESPFGPLKQQTSRKIFTYLISILNATYPDHDFTSLQPSNFTKVPSSSKLIAKFNNTLTSLGRESQTSPSIDYPHNTDNNNNAASSSNRADKDLLGTGQGQYDWIWNTINTHINFNTSEIWELAQNQFIPGLDDEGNLWRLNYFIFNKKMKRVAFLYLSSKLKNSNRAFKDDDEMDEGDDGEPSREIEGVIDDGESEYDLGYDDDIIGDLEMD